MRHYEDILSKQLVKLMLGSSNVFMVNVLLNLQREITTEIPTAAVSNTTLLINPDFMMSLSDTDQQFVLLHEACHVAFFDVDRCEGLDPNVWNQATDHYINLMLLSEGWAPPEGALCDCAFSNWEKKAIYDYLMEHPEEQSQDMCHGDMDALTPCDAKAIEELSGMVQSAAIQAKGIGGSIPPSIHKYLEELYAPKLDWYAILENCLHAAAKEDYSYGRLNRQYLQHGMYVPSLYSEGLDTIAIAIDSSGSVSDTEYATYLGFISDILKRCEPNKIEVVAFTSHIVNTWELDKPEDIEGLKFRSSGGTALKPVFDHFRDKPPTALIIFSDMDCKPHTHPEGYEVINIIVNNPKSYKGIGKSIYIRT